MAKLLRSPARYAGWVLLALSCAGLALAYTKVPGKDLKPPAPLPPPSPDAEAPLPDLSAAPWHVFAPAAGLGSTPAGPLAARFRLAGTFFSFGSSGPDQDPSGRIAILDDLSEDRQHMVNQGSSIGDVIVERVFPDRVLIRSGEQREELKLAFSDRPDTQKTRAASTDPEPEGDSFANMPALDTNRFGKRIGENRWVFYRDKLQAYYQELLDEPERLAAVYLSLKPTRSEDGAIAGYFLGTEGEEDLFRHAGFKEGDVIRSVNSIRMVSQPRGEYVFREFLNNNLNTFVFDIERDGEEQKLIYLIR